MNPENIYREHLEKGEEWADKLGAAELLEGALKSLKAQLTLEAKSAEGCSMSEAESIALSTHTYREAQSEAVRARTSANKAKVGYEAVKALFEARRSQEATERAANRVAA